MDAGPAALESSRGSRKSCSIPTEQENLQAIRQAALDEECTRLALAPQGQRNDQLNRSSFNLGQLVANGMLRRNEVEERLGAVALAVGLSAHEVSATLRSGIEGGIQEPRRSEARFIFAPTSPDQRPSVLVPGAHCDDEGVYTEQANDMFAHQVLDAIPTGQLYRRGGIVGTLLGEPGRRRWLGLSPDDIRIVVHAHVRLRAWKTNKKGESLRVFCPCTNDLARLILAAALHHKNVRELTWITNSPVFLPGFKLARPGWNEEGVYYDEPHSLAGLEPDLDSEGFRACIDDLLGDFPFADDASRENFVALLLTPMRAPAIDGNRPLFLINAPLPRTGKSKLVEEVAGGILLGTRTPALQLPQREEEREKRLGALVLEGSTLVHLDNLAGELNSASLASLLTASSFQFRILGSSKMASPSNSLTLVGTGNNVRCSTELAKRIVAILLLPNDQHPELRTGFRHPDLYAYVLANRRRVYAYLLGAVENWVREGQKQQGRPFGGFDAWSRTVGSILANSGFTRFLTNQREFCDQSDEESAGLDAFVRRWYECFAEE